MLPRIGITLVCGLWFASYWSEVQVWFGVDGVMRTDLAAKLVAFDEYPRWQVWSPLWWTDNQSMYLAWLIIGIAVSVIAATGIGGRWTLGCLLFLVIGWSNRLTWLSGLVEPALCAFLGYLLVFPGGRIFGKEASEENRAAWLSAAVNRLIQIHVWLLLAATLLSQLIGVIWWRGESIWWLASAGQSTLFTKEMLSDRPVLVNGLSHAWIALEFVALWLLCTKSAQNLGIVCGVMSGLAIGLGGNQLLYGLLISAALLAYVRRGKSGQVQA